MAALYSVVVSRSGALGRGRLSHAATCAAIVLGLVAAVSCAASSERTHTTAASSERTHKHPVRRVAALKVTGGR